MKQSITYNNKKMKLPYTLTAGETSTEMVTRQNPFSGQSIELPELNGYNTGWARPVKTSLRITPLAPA